MKLLFNPYGDSDYGKRQMINGNSTNLFELTNLKYEWAKRLYDVMMQNFWKPEEISLVSDAKQYEELTEKETEAFDKIICFLVFLDSIQTNNVPNLSSYITAPEINLLLAIHTYQEAIHAQSYGYILESVVSAEKRQYIYNLWRDDKQLLKRNKYIADIYQDFLEDRSTWNFIRASMANYILEGIYFYSGFSFFYNLARNGKMTGVGTEIKYVNRDEITHLVLFQNIFNELQKENPYLFEDNNKKYLQKMMREAVDHEIEWANYVIGDKIDGLNIGIIEQYIKYLSNFRLNAIGIDPIYPEVTTNPMTWIDNFTNFNQVKTDFFEEKVINYSKASSLNLDDL